MEKELKIEVPQGYEIDKQKSTFEKIVFKKADPFAKLPKTWKEYCDCNRGNVSYFWSSSFKPHLKAPFVGSYNEFSTEGRLMQYVALGELLQLRDYWVCDWSPEVFNSDSSVFAIVCGDTSKAVNVVSVSNVNLPLTFPTEEMAKEFKNCFEALIKDAYPLV